MTKHKTQRPGTASRQFLTLPDYLRRGLKLVFIGLNPGLYSAQQKKYYARATNRFWPALSAANYFGRQLQPGDERMLFAKGVGFTDVVKRASGQIDELSAKRGSMFCPPPARRMPIIPLKKSPLPFVIAGNGCERKVFLSKVRMRLGL